MHAKSGMARETTNAVSVVPKVAEVWDQTKASSGHRLLGCIGNDLTWIGTIGTSPETCNVMHRGPRLEKLGRQVLTSCQPREAGVQEAKHAIACFELHRVDMPLNVLSDMIALAVLHSWIFAGLPEHVVMHIISCSGS